MVGRIKNLTKIFIQKLQHFVFKSRRRKLFTMVVAILFIVSIIYFSTGDSSASITSSKLARVERGNIARSVVAIGKIEPIRKVEIKSKASGIIKTLNVEVGSLVKEGDILTELDKDNLRARVREAQAALLGEQANLQAAKAQYEKNEIEARGPDLPFLEKKFTRSQELFKANLISRDALDEAENNLNIASNKQQAALANLAVMKAQIAQAEARVEQAKAVLERAQEELQNSTIRSPIDGMVLTRDVEIGGAVSSILQLGSAATLVMTLGDISEVYVQGRVDESDIGKVAVGQPARIVVESFRDKKFAGEVTKIAPIGIEENNVTTFEVHVSVQNYNGELLANMSANAEIILEEHQDVLLIPEGAITYDKDRNSFIELFDPTSESGKKKIAIAVGISDGLRTEVTGIGAELEEGHQVILN